MSHHSEDNFMSACSDSFWEPGNYKRTTKRIEDGNKLCTDLMGMVAERAEIEKNYAKQLKTWASKWNNLIEKGPEYGTMEAGWKAVLVESDRRCDLHNRVREDLHIKVNNQLKGWQKDNYHKSMMQLKEKKEMDEQFKKAQKPWAKLLQKVNKSKADYHNACKSEKSAVNMERNASGDSSVSQDHKWERYRANPFLSCLSEEKQMKKLQDRVSKTKDQVSRCRDTYEAALHDLNNYNAKYMEDMTDVFERCQRMEAQRLQCFKDILFSVQKCLNISEDPVLPQIYEEFYHTVNNADHEKDLRLWSNTHGVNMAMNWPQFEEYTEEFRDIAAGKSKKISGANVVGEGNITLLNQRHVGDDLPPPEFLKKKIRRSYHDDCFIEEYPSNSSKANGKKDSKFGTNANGSSRNNQQHSIGGSNTSTTGNYRPELSSLGEDLSKSENERQKKEPYNPFECEDEDEDDTDCDRDSASDNFVSCSNEEGSLKYVGGNGEFTRTATNSYTSSRYDPYDGINSPATTIAADGPIMVMRVQDLESNADDDDDDVSTSFNGDKILMFMDELNKSVKQRKKAFNGGSTNHTDRTPFEEEEWDENVDHVDPLEDNGEPGVKVRALYDYEAAESDELDFKAGDTFEKLEDEDEQGWCKGRKDGKVGLYPANYIEVL